MKNAQVWIAGMVLLLGTGSAAARTEFLGRLPNSGRFTCALCHDAGNTVPPAANPFGLAAGIHIVNGQLDWRAMYSLDSDGDGATNGAELGDPCGSYDVGETAPRTTDISNPALARSECTNCGPVCVCGDGVSGAAEVCDGADLANASCGALGYVEPIGAVCSATCDAVDTSACLAVCGNGVVEPGETCDDGKSADSGACTTRCALNTVSNGTAVTGGCGLGSSGAPALTLLVAALFLGGARTRRRR